VGGGLGVVGGGGGGGGVGARPHPPTPQPPIPNPQSPIFELKQFYFRKNNNKYYNFN